MVTSVKRRNINFKLTNALIKKGQLALIFGVTRQAHLARSVWLGRCSPSLVVPLRLLIKGDLQIHSKRVRNAHNAIHYNLSLSFINCFFFFS